MSEKTLTAANCTFALSISDLYPIPQVLSNFSSDNPFTTEDTVIAETQLSLEGKLSAGFVPSTIKQAITLMATSASIQMLVDWMQASRTDKTVYRCDGIITIPGIGTSYVLSNGVLISGKQIPDAKKVLQPISFKIEWESVVAVAL